MTNLPRVRRAVGACFVSLLLITAAISAGDASVPAAASAGTLKWVYDTGATINKSSPALGPDGTIYVGNGGVYVPPTPAVGLFAINPDGTLKWKYAIANYVFSPVVGRDGTIYVQDATGSLYALTPAGTLKWKYVLNTPLDADSRTGLLAPAIDADGTIYVGADALYAINPDGTLKWRFLPASIPFWPFWTLSQIRTAPAIAAAGTIYVAATLRVRQTANQPDALLGAVLWAVNRDGTLKWQYAIGSSFAASSPSIDADGTVYVGTGTPQAGTGDSFVYAFAPDGTVKWSYRINTYEVHSSPTIGTDGTIYVATRRNREFGESAYLLALTRDGRLQWAFHVPAHDAYPSPAIGADGIIYFADSGEGEGGTNGGRVYALRPDGTVVWSYLSCCESITESSPTLASDGTLYIGDNRGKLYALTTTSLGLASTPWPKFHHDATNRGGATPGAPRGLTASIGVRTVTLTWNPPEWGSVAGYVVEVGSRTGTSDLVVADTGAVATTLVATVNDPGTYYFRVRAKSAGGVGPPSNEAVVTIGSSP